jgi:hypothetical protein
MPQGRTNVAEIRAATFARSNPTSPSRMMHMARRASPWSAARAAAVAARCARRWSQGLSSLAPRLRPRRSRHRCLGSGALVTASQTLRRPRHFRTKACICPVRQAMPIRCPLTRQIIRDASLGRVARTQASTACRRSPPVRPCAIARLRQLMMSGRFPIRRCIGFTTGGAPSAPGGGIIVSPWGGTPGGGASVWAMTDVHVILRARIPATSVSLNI